jgi:hypothetical protein
MLRRELTAYDVLCCVASGIIVMQMDILGETKAGGINNSENVKDVRFLFSRLRTHGRALAAFSPLPLARRNGSADQ